MTVVVDASVAVKWVVPEEHTEAALALWDRWQTTGELLIAPPLFRSEVTNVLHRKARRGDLSGPVATEALDHINRLVVTPEPAGLYRQAFALAGELGLGSTYDSLYLALAEGNGCEFWTADARFVRASQARHPRVRWVGDAIASGG